MTETSKVTAQGIDASDDRGRYQSFAIFDAAGKIILDALNSETAEIHEESDGEPGGFQRWDEDGRKNCEAVAAALNDRADLLSAVSTFLEPYKELSDQVLWKFSDGQNRINADEYASVLLTGIKGEHHAASVLAFRKIIEQVGGKS